MVKTLDAREAIYDHMENGKCQWTVVCSHGEFERYCVAKDTIQDTGEAISAHRAKGFNPNVYLRYIEYYGILQAVYMQQDAIHALVKLFLPKTEINWKLLPCWSKLRDLRNNTVGHPVGKLKRLNRNIIGYDTVNYLSCPDSDSTTWTSNSESLAQLLDLYDEEAACVLNAVIAELEASCATKHVSS